MIQNNITFDSVKTGAKAFSFYPLVMKNQQGPDEDGMGIINAVDIDWNNAALNAAKPSEPIEGFPNGTVNTTGDLLKNIANLQAQVDLLTTLVKGLYSALT